jgi:hypothetical protein
MYNLFLKWKEFDGTIDTPVEILHVFLLGIVKYLVTDFMSKQQPTTLAEIEARWSSFNTDTLNTPAIQPRYMIQHYRSFVGKDYCIVLQAAPFVFFPFMNKLQKELWISLCYVGSLIFQTRIPELNQYLEELNIATRSLMYYLAKMNARWVNKPKIHMLLHLPESIRQFGPPCLFATEKFESYNGVLCTSSVHSNRLSPERDLAISFANYQTLRLLLSGAYIFDSFLNQ